ncbi:MAG: hydrogenase subunit MbhD domain-containing protein [Erysipelotrichaceae bacterium]|nr:DUF4040 domain-containing protein [Solobacterium sp.]MDY2731444.1 hydrogenase subunit MbhD domain-containing protein [Erysipelotrichaceae bacterium]MCI7732649.1 DUF4040 domain-containing protein [Solobacterium sp.]MDD6955357.1 DUF4040 domain-containing protein [Solobacterium sp.]MDY4640613.1 hydrogenase subunit MbhD domain-containing protein [Erysipelotrichaceae bacterium]
MNYIEIVLLVSVLVCGIATCVCKNLMASLIIYMAYSVVMSIIWALLQSPDLAITEAAVGAGISSILLFITLRKIKDLQKRGFKDEDK